MNAGILEHLNITVEKPHELAQALTHLFDWKIRWEGESLDNGYTVHVGGENSYLALYTPEKLTGEPIPPYQSDRAMNHIGVLVEDLDEVRARVVNAGLTIGDENENPPGRRFYFHVQGIEFDVVQY